MLISIEKNFGPQRLKCSTHFNIKAKVFCTHSRNKMRWNEIFFHLCEFPKCKGK